MDNKIQQKTALALKFVLLFGAVSLFADLTYEGGASINGQFMATLGAGAAIVSVTSGLGEFLGYALRLLSGWIADKTGKYWAITFIGYIINLFAVPAMFFAGYWWVAAVLILAERIGRALRKPTVEAMLSYATGALGKGWVYALNTALDETGAALGPLVISIVLLFGGNYRIGYAVLLISAVMAISLLTLARFTFPIPSRLEIKNIAMPEGFSKAFWLSTLAGLCFGTGFVSYELVPFHLAKTQAVAFQWIPLLLSFSTACGVGVNLLLGKLFDRAALPTIFVAVVISSLFAPLVFLGGMPGIFLGMIAWGVSYAIEDTLFSAIVAGYLPEGKRGFAFGLFFAVYGVGVLLGSIIMGFMYSYSISLMAGFSLTLQLLSLPLFFAVSRFQKRSA